jgi:probable HAF family extracellular repeat protein
MKLRRACCGSICAFALALFGFAPVAHAQVATQVVEMGVPDPNVNWSSRPMGINDHGQVAVQIGGGADTYLWDPVNRWINIGGLGRWVSPDAGINNDGTVVGLNLVTDMSRNDGVIFRPDIGWRVMSGFETAYNGGPAGVFPRGLNNLGQVVGGSWAGSFIWDAVSGPAFIPRSDSWAAADINDSGQVTGTDWATYRAFLWSAQTGQRLLEGFGSTSEAAAINNTGQVAGWAYMPGVGTHAVVWDPVSGMKDLGVFGAYFEAEFCLCWVESSLAYGLNDAGQVVGISSTPEGSFRAFIWDAASGMRELFAPGTMEWARPKAINNNGEVVGTMRASTGHEMGFYATVPPPGPATPEEQAEAIADAVTALIDGGLIAANDAGPLTSSIQGALQSLANGQVTAATGQLSAAVNKVAALVRSRRLGTADGAALTQSLDELIDAIDGN